MKPKPGSAWGPACLGGPRRSLQSLNPLQSHFHQLGLGSCLPPALPNWSLAGELMGRDRSSGVLFVPWNLQEGLGIRGSGPT
jgi:hypothetical protein